MEYNLNLLFQSHTAWTFTYRRCLTSLVTIKNKPRKMSSSENNKCTVAVAHTGTSGIKCIRTEVQE